MGYHVAKIIKGEYGKFSKIQEEYQEALDAITQANPVMVFLELSDLIGAIEGYAESRGLTLDDLIKMKDATRRTFEDGTRKSVLPVENHVVPSTVNLNVWTVEDIIDQREVYSSDFNKVVFIAVQDSEVWCRLVDKNDDNYTMSMSKEEMVDYLNYFHYGKEPQKES